MSLENKVIVITGAASGIGRALTERFSSQGAKIAMIDTSEEQLNALAEQIPSSLPVVMDITDEQQVENGFEHIAGHFGQIDVLVNNAGILRDALLIKVKDGEVVQKLSLDAWQAVIDVNLTGTFLCGRAAASYMAVNNGGVIVNISSIARNGNKGQTSYAASKAGVVGITTTWASDLSNYGIRVGAIAPGFVDTPMIQQMRPDMLEKMVSKVPLKRVAKLDEIANGIQFIIQNDYFNGRVLELDGGLRF